MIFTAKAQLIDLSQGGRFQRALVRWKNIWDHPEEGHRHGSRGGFMVHAEELWLLAHKFLKSDLKTLVSQFGTGDMAQARRWLAELDGTDTQRTGTQRLDS